MSEILSISRMMDPDDEEGKAARHERLQAGKSEDARIAAQREARAAAAYRRSPAGMLADLHAKQAAQARTQRPPPRQHHTP